MMRIMVATQNPSLTYYGQRYIRGEVYEVDDDLGAKLRASGDFKIATMPPPDPKQAGMDRAARLLDRLASLPDGAIERFERMLGYADSEAQAEAEKDDGAEVVTNDEPRTMGSAVVDDENDEDLADMTVSQLRALARQRGVDLGSARLKDDIVSALRDE
jgi:hypothetical protein